MTCRFLTKTLQCLGTRMQWEHPGIGSQANAGFYFINSSSIKIKGIPNDTSLDIQIPPSEGVFLVFFGGFQVPNLSRWPWMSRACMLYW